jgi:hypothetical protein
VAAILESRATLVFATIGAAAFALSFLLLHDRPMFLPHQGVQGLLAADSLIAGRGLEVVPGMPFAKFGPLYPLLLAGLGRSGVEPTPAVYAINCATFGVTLFGLLWLGRTLDVRALAAVAALFSCFAPNWYLIRAARPDTIVIAASFLALPAMIAYARRPGPGPLAGAALAASVAALTRYMAVLTLLPVFGVAVALARGVSWRRRLADLAVFGAVAAGPIALWMARNVRLTGFATGMSRSDSRPWVEHYGLGGNLAGFFRTIWIDAFGHRAIGTPGVVYGDVPLPVPGLALTGGAIALGLLAFALWRGRARLGWLIAEGLRERSARGCALLITGSYGVLYSAALIVVWTLSNNDPIETRYVAPLYGLLWLYAAAVLGEGLRSLPRRRAAALVLAAAAIVAVPNAVKSWTLLGSAPPGPTLMPIASFGPRGSNWIEPLTWDDLGAASPARGDE